MVRHVVWTGGGPGAVCRGARGYCESRRLEFWHGDACKTVCADESDGRWPARGAVGTKEKGLRNGDSHSCAAGFLREHGGGALRRNEARYFTVNGKPPESRDIPGARILEWAGCAFWKVFGGR